MSEKTIQRNILDYIILGTLAHQHCSGYDLKEIINNRIGMFWQEYSYGTIYRRLEWLFKQGYLICEKIPSNKKNDTTVKVYGITDKGHQELKKWLQLLPTVEMPIHEKEIGLVTGQKVKIYQGNILQLLPLFLLKFYFGGNKKVPENIEMIERTHEDYIDKISFTLGLIDKQFDVISNSDIDHVYYQLTARLGIYLCEAYRKWKQEAVKVLIELSNRNDLAGE